MTALMTMEHRVGTRPRSTWPTTTGGGGFSRVLGIAQLMVILDGTIVNIALPTAQHDLHFSNADRQWIVTAYSLAFGSLLLLGGRIGDMVGRKRALIIGLVGFAAASAIGGASVNFAMLVIARTVQGAFGALLAPSVLALLTTTFTDPDERGRAFGIYGAIAGAGGALGLLLGGILTSYASWRWTLFVNLVFAAIAIVGALLWLKNDKGARPRPVGPARPVPGGRRAVLARLRFLARRDHGVEQSLHDRVPRGGGGPACCVRLLRDQGEVPAPPTPGRAQPNAGRIHLGHAVRQRRDLRCVLVPDLLPAGHAGVQPGEDRHRVPSSGGRLGRDGPGVQSILLPRFGPKPIVPIGLLISAAALFGLHLVGLHSSYVSHVLPYLIVLGVGFGLSVAPAFSTGTLGLAPQDAGVGSATLNTAQQVGGSIGTALLNTAGRQCRHVLPGRSGPDPGQSPGRPAPQLHDGVPVVLLDLRCRSRRRRPGAPARRPDGAGVGEPDREGRNRHSRKNLERTSAAYGSLVGELSRYLGSSGLSGLFHRELRRRVGLEAIVGNWLPAPNRVAVVASFESSFRPIDRGQPLL